MYQGQWSSVFNPSKKLVMGCYAHADFAGLWVHEDPQDPICARSRTGFVVTFNNCPLLWVSKLQTEIALLLYILSMWHCLIPLEHYFL